MGKTAKCKAKAARKAAAAKRKIERKAKCGKIAAVAVASAIAAVLGCATADSSLPAKSQTQENRFDGCTFVMAAKTTISNGVIVAEGAAVPALEMFTQTQSLESTGSTDTFGQANTQTPTTDVKPDVDVRYNDAVSAGGNAAAAFLSSLTSDSLAALRDYIVGRKSGRLTVTKKDGSTEMLECRDGSCAYSGGTITAADCAACSD